MELTSLSLLAAEAAGDIFLLEPLGAGGSDCSMSEPGDDISSVVRFRRLVFDWTFSSEGCGEATAAEAALPPLT